MDSPQTLRIEAQSLSQTIGSYKQGAEIFNVNLDWSGPLICILMGESGVGKSTLLKTLGGVWMPQNDSLKINGKHLWQRSPRAIDRDSLKKIGFCFQNNALFNSMSCLENLCFAHRNRYPHDEEAQRHSKAIEWLKRVELNNVEKLFPHEISGGMQKRLAIARTLMLEPEIIFFDDPTAGLDPITSRQIIQLLNELLHEKPSLSVIVTNDEDRAKQLGKTYYSLENGQLTERELS